MTLVLVPISGTYFGSRHRRALSAVSLEKRKLRMWTSRSACRDLASLRRCIRKVAFTNFTFLDCVCQKVALVLVPISDT